MFNAQWKLIALHHAGGTEMPKLNNKEGTYAANKGIWLQSIGRAIAEHLGAAAPEYSDRAGGRHEALDTIAWHTEGHSMH